MLPLLALLRHGKLAIDHSSRCVLVRRRVLLLLLVASAVGTSRGREAQPLPVAEALAKPGTRRAPERHGLAMDFYAKTCPAVDQIVASVTAARFRDYPAAGPGVLRLFHHDCFVEVRNNHSGLYVHNARVCVKIRNPRIWHPHTAFGYF
jgi:hypothetical protein